MTAGEASAGSSRPNGTAVARGLLEEMFTEEFFEKHWERRPLHFRASERGKTANRLPEALSVDDLAELVRRAGPSLKMFRRGEPVEAETFVEGYLEGATLIVNQADRCHETLFTLCRALAERLFMHVFSVVYLTPPGTQAVRMHTDDQDVFLLQVWGKKRWIIRDAPTKLPYTKEMLGKDAPVAEELVGEPIMEFTIEPHDVLYIPRGFLHEATTGDEPSLHITVTVPTSDFSWGVQLVKHLMQQPHAENAQTPPLLKGFLGGGREVDENELDSQLKGFVDNWLKGLTSSGVLDAFERRLGRTNETQARQFGRQTEPRPGPPRVREDSRVRLMSEVTCQCDEAAERAVFACASDGMRLEMPIYRRCIPLLQSLTHKPKRVSELPCEDAFERICLLQTLNYQGVVQLFVRGPAG